MSPETLWPLADHTIGKHRVLRRYLNAWFPIMSSVHGRILFIDGFAGPGKYSGGEDGSPIIALRSILEHKAKLGNEREIAFIFIEKAEDRAEFLKSLTDALKPELPDKVRIEVINGVFDQTLTETLDNLDAESLRLAPSFVMIDPFGVSDTPMSVIQRIMQHPSSETYVSVMTRDINRFLSTDEFDAHLTELFGTDRWKEALTLNPGQERLDFIFTLYRDQLKAAGAKYVIRFDLCEGNQLVYSIFFASHNLTGCDRMKEAIWSIDKWGGYEFRSAKSGQLEMDLANPDLSKFEKELLDRFSAVENVTIEQLVDFSKSDQTDFHSGHLKRKTLIAMEKNGKLEVVSSPRTRKYSYPPGTTLRLIS